MSSLQGTKVKPVTELGSSIMDGITGSVRVVINENRQTEVGSVLLNITSENAISVTHNSYF